MEGNSMLTSGFTINYILGTKLYASYTLVLGSCMPS